jgi:hypothetical protein
VVVSVASLVLVGLDDQVRTPTGSAGAGHGRFPVVELAGLFSDGSGFGPLTAVLQAHGVPVIDFRPDVPGAQPLTWNAPSAATHIPQLATQIVAPAIDDGLRRAGLDPARQVVDVVAHSVGGLIARYLIEKTGPQADAPSWAARIDDVVMVATPNHGSEIGFLEATLGPGHDSSDGIAGDMKPSSSFLRRMGTREPPGEVYTTIGGDPWLFRWLRSGHHGFDGAVPAESPFLDGAARYTFPQTHGRLLRARSVVDLIRTVVDLETDRVGS